MKRSQLILIFLSVLALLLIVLTTYNWWQKKLALSVIKTDPIDNAVQIAIDQPVAVYFNRPLKNGTASFAIMPEIEFVQDLIPEQNLIILKHRAYFNTNRLYTVIVYDQKQKPFYQFSFNTISSQSNPALIQKVIERQKLNYPLLQYLPYEDENFFIDYQKPLSLYVKIKNSKTTQEDVLLWLKERGTDPTTHQIFFAPR